MHAAESMSNEHQSAHPWEWRLDPGVVARLAPGDAPRWLQVTDGEVWLTPLEAQGRPDDLWLRPGDRQLLPAGTAWLAQGWPRARAEVLLAAPPGCAAVAPRRPRRVAQGLRRSLSALRDAWRAVAWRHGPTMRAPAAPSSSHDRHPAAPGAFA